MSYWSQSGQGNVTVFVHCFGMQEGVALGMAQLDSAGLCSNWTHQRRAPIECNDAWWSNPVTWMAANIQVFIPTYHNTC